MPEFCPLPVLGAREEPCVDGEAELRDEDDDDAVVEGTCAEDMGLFDIVDGIVAASFSYARNI